MEKGKTAVIYLERHGFVYVEQDNKTALHCKFSENTVRDMEVKSKEAMITELQAFIRLNNLLPARLIMFLSHDLLFEIQLTDTRQVHREIEREHFVASVPFEHLSVKEYSNNEGILLIVTNRDYYETIVALFREEGFVCEAVVPISAVKGIGVDGERGFEGSVAEQLLRKFEVIKQYSMPLPTYQKNDIVSHAVHGNNAVILAVVSVAVLLIGALLLLIFRSR